MARVKNGILGGFSGKVGTVVGYNLGQESYIRSRPIRRAKYTDNELANMARFKLVQDCLSPLKDLLKVGFKGYGTKTGGYRSAVSYTRKVALVADDAGFYIDPALLKVSGGNLPQAASPSVAYESPLKIKFNWNISDVPYEFSSDQVLLVVYDMEEKTALTCIFNGAFRNAGTQTIELTADYKGKTLHTYIGFVAADRSAQSDSQYLGTVSVPA
uniref:DUF6266 family protein n=1 Tax=Pedobacter schmidteae TaxID=2201271 RepID=UPI000EB5CB49|nr:DUF6266 family protein [Pedobacter schmidteae]